MLFGRANALERAKASWCGEQEPLGVGFGILFRTDKFNELIRENTTGSVRQTLSFTSMGNIKSPLPPIEKQREIVEKYNAKIKLAEEQEF